jgi:ribonuclease HI
MIDVQIVFDGGSRGNPGPAYGSYRISGAPLGPGGPVRRTFGRGTNNEAEYLTLLAALQDLIRRLGEQGIQPQEVRLKVFGDSQLVIRQLNGEWKARDARMRALRDQCRHMLRPLGDVQLIRHDRRESVRALGH